MAVSLRQARDLGLAKYHTGKPCKRGHISDRFTCSSKCVECRKEDKRNWRNANPEPDRLKCLNWQKANPDKIRANINRRRARIKGAGGNATAAQLQSLLEAQDYACTYCNAGLWQGRHIDHKVPLSRGGSNNIENIQWLCPTCNMCKGASTYLEYENKLRTVAGDLFLKNF